MNNLLFVGFRKSIFYELWEKAEMTIVVKVEKENYL